MAKAGRPPTYTREDYTDAICEWVAEGKTLREFCRKPGNPGWVTVYRWLKEDADLAERFARARDLGADAIAEDTLEIIDEPPATVVDDKGVSRIDSGHVAWAKNRVEQRMKLLSKWNPKKYGDKVTQELTGADGGPVEVASMWGGRK